MPEGYTNEYGIKIEFTQATYVAGTASSTIVNPYMADQEIATGTDLGFVVIRHGNDFVVWTPRPLQDGELDTIKNTVVNASDQFNKITDPSRTVTCISGLPKTVNVGNKEAVSVYMKDGSVWVKFINPSAQSDLVYGTIPYIYTQTGGEGGGTITNTKKTTDFEFDKKWLNAAGQEQPWDLDIEVTVQRLKDPETVDDTFSLKYSICKSDIENGKEFAPSGAEAQTGPKLKLTVNDNGSPKYTFKLEGLDAVYEINNSSSSDPESGSASYGKYTYFVKETNSQLQGYKEPAYANEHSGVGHEAAFDKGTIVNAVENGVVLPNTGGIGTTLFTALGGLMTVTAGAILTIRRKKQYS